MGLSVSLVKTTYNFIRECQIAPSKITALMCVDHSDSKDPTDDAWAFRVVVRSGLDCSLHAQS